MKSLRLRRYGSNVCDLLSWFIASRPSLWSRSSRLSMLSMRRSERVPKSHRGCTHCHELETLYLSSRPWRRSAQSTLTNKSRLKLLHRREENLQDLFSTSRASVVQLAKDEGRYVQFLQGVIIQGFLQILEPTVVVYARPQDVELVKQAASNAQESYTEISGRKVEYEVEGSLSDDAWVFDCPLDMLKAQIFASSLALVVSSWSVARVVSLSIIRWMSVCGCLRTGWVAVVLFNMLQVFSYHGF